MRMDGSLARVAHAQKMAGRRVHGVAAVVPTVVRPKPMFAGASSLWSSLVGASRSRCAAGNRCALTTSGIPYSTVSPMGTATNV